MPQDSPAAAAPLDLTLAAVTDRLAAQRGDADALLFGGRATSFRQLNDQVQRTAAALKGAGVRKGDRVGYLALNSDDYVLMFFAAMRIGAVMVAINWRLVAREIAYVLADAGIRLLVTERQFLAQADAAGGIERIILLDDAPGFRDWALGHDPDAAIAEVVPDDIAVQMYTSGTTGFPKGALMTHRNLVETAGKQGLVGARWAEWTADDVALVGMPMFHISGTGWVLHALLPGGKAVILEKPDIDAIVRAIDVHGITKMFAVPAVLGMILSHPAAANADFGSLRCLLYGASPIPLDVLKRAMKAFRNAEFVQCYGATETSGTVVVLPPEDHDPGGNPRMLSCGKPYPGNEVRIVDADMRDRPVGEVGEIAVKSVSVMAGYHNKPEATAKAIRDGWYLTGDAGYLDADGYLYIHDRVKDMIVSGAENIYPAEVENALHEHPGVADCAVIGVPDAKWGEAVKAIVVRAPGSDVGEAELIAFARGRIAAYKVPKSVDFADTLPRNASGKILKKDLRAPYWPSEGRQVG
jgi:long-chain acyl-CoA synthetase